MFEAELKHSASVYRREFLSASPFIRRSSDITHSVCLPPPQRPLWHRGGGNLPAENQPRKKKSSNTEKSFALIPESWKHVYLLPHRVSRMITGPLCTVHVCSKLTFLFPVSADQAEHLSTSLQNFKQRQRAQHFNLLCDLIKHVNGPAGGAGGRADCVSRAAS